MQRPDTAFYCVKSTKISSVLSKFALGRRNSAPIGGRMSVGRAILLLASAGADPHLDDLAALDPVNRHHPMAAFG